MSDERMFPIQSERSYPRPFPTHIPWSVAEKAYGVYSSRYGRGQTLERLAERGGFGPGEMDMFHPGWLEEVSEITQLRAENANLQALNEQLAARVAAQSELLSRAAERQCPIPVTERLPERRPRHPRYSVEVLVYGLGGFMATAYDFDSGEWCFADDVICWWPLPLAPPRTETKRNT